MTRGNAEKRSVADRGCLAMPGGSFLHQGALGDAEFLERLHAVQQGGGIRRAGKEILIGADGSGGGGGVLVEQLDAEAGEAGGAEVLIETRAGLGAAVEESVAAADVRLQPVALADAARSRSRTWPMLRS